MKVLLIKFAVNAAIVAAIAFLSLVATSADSLGPYGPTIGAAAALMLAALKKATGRDAATPVRPSGLPKPPTQPFAY